MGWVIFIGYWGCVYYLGTLADAGVITTDKGINLSIVLAAVCLVLLGITGNLVRKEE